MPTTTLPPGSLERTLDDVLVLELAGLTDDAAKVEIRRRRDASRELERLSGEVDALQLRSIVHAACWVEVEAGQLGVRAESRQAIGTWVASDCLTVLTVGAMLLTSASSASARRPITVRTARKVRDESQGSQGDRTLSVQCKFVEADGHGRQRSAHCRELKVVTT